MHEGKYRIHHQYSNYSISLICESGSIWKLTKIPPTVLLNQLLKEKDFANLWGAFTDKKNIKFILSHHAAFGNCIYTSHKTGGDKGKLIKSNIFWDEEMGNFMNVSKKTSHLFRAIQGDSIVALNFSSMNITVIM